RAENLLYGDDGSAFDKLGKAAAEVEALVRIDADLAPIGESLAVARREIEEAARELQRYADRIEAEPARLQEVETRLLELTRLCRKHGGRVVDVLARSKELRSELGTLENADARLADLDGEIASASADVLRLARQLSE